MSYGLTSDEVLAAIQRVEKVNRRDLSGMVHTNIQTIRHHLRKLMANGSVTIVARTSTQSTDMNWYGATIRPKPPSWNGSATVMLKANARELALTVLLQQWGAWKLQGTADNAMHAFDAVIVAKLTAPECAALAHVHAGVDVWDFPRMDWYETYQDAHNALSRHMENNMKSRFWNKREP